MSTKELVPIAKENALEVFTGEKLDDYLKAIQEDAENFVGSVETDKGRKQIASKAYSIAQEKVKIDKVGKALVVELKSMPNLIDKARKKSRDFLDELSEMVREPLTNWEIADKAKKEAEALAKEIEKAYNIAISEDDLFNRQKEVERKEAELKAQEEEKAEAARKEQEEKERIEYEAKIAREAKERAEREAEEKIEAEKQRVIDEQNRAKEAAELAEMARLKAIETAERERLDAIEKAKAEERCEAARVKKEEQDRVAEEKRIADKKARHHAHQKKINREALDSFVENGIEEKQAIEIITMIAHGKIKNITLNY